MRRSLLIFEGDPTGFLTRPISGTLFVLFVLVALPAIQALRHRRRAAAHRAAESDDAHSPDNNNKELV